MKRKLSYRKISSLVFLILDIAIIVWVNSGFKGSQLITWLLFEIIVMFVPINVMIIGYKKRRK